MIDLKPWLRAAKYGWLEKISEYKARHSQQRDRLDDTPLVFLIGCGRSGTSILGSLMSLHPNVFYFFEPYHLWAAIDPATDATNFYHRIEARCFMDASHCTKEAQLCFNHLFTGKLHQRLETIIEKTPINTLRIGYLNALAPHAKFVHIVRDGVDVSRSIARLATTNSYKIAGKPKLNQWWGVENSKWKALSLDGAGAGYYPDEVALLKTDYERGAYEWLVSLGEVDRWRKQLGDRLHEITYNQLTTDPEATLCGITGFLNLDSPTPWLEQTVKKIAPTRQTGGATLKLPPAMCKAFNSYQERFGFANYAVIEAD